jgi:hypothetical protein
MALNREIDGNYRFVSYNIEMSAERIQLDQKWQTNFQLIDLPLTKPTEIDPTRAIALGDQLEPQQLLTHAIDDGITQFVQHTNPEFTTELEVSELMLSQRTHFLEHPISSILTPTRAGAAAERTLRQFNFEFTQLEQKQEALTGLQDFVVKQSGSQVLSNDVAQAADELFTNSLNHNGGASRPALIFAGVDSHRLVIGCRDYAGTLKVRKLLMRMSDCYALGLSYTINMGEGGAGIGCYMVFNLCMSLYAGVEAGKQTVMCCSFPLKGSTKTRTAIPKNLHYFAI